MTMRAVSIDAVRASVRASARWAMLPVVLVAIGLGSVAAGQEKVLRLPMDTAGPRSLDPALATSTYDNRAIAQVYETLVQYKYFVRPYELEPLLITEMPTISEDGRTFRFELRDDVFFQDDECFPGGKGRKLVASDVFYSWKRLANPKYRLQGWPKLDGLVVGLNAYKESQEARVAAGDAWDYDVPVEGFRVIDDRTLEVELTQANRQFMWKLATSNLAVVPREAVEFYGERINSRMVGTGPWQLDAWQPNTNITFDRNPTFREEFFPSEFDDEAIERGWDISEGERLPLCDRLEFTFFVEKQTEWLEFKAGNLDYTHVRDAGFAEAFNPRTKRLKSSFRRRGWDHQPIALFDFIFRGFNMDDEIVGGYTPDKIALRRAIALSIDLGEMNDSVYDGLPVIYDGPIPPGIPGHPEGGELMPSNRGPDLRRARALLEEAGYTVVDGKVTDLDPIDYWTNRSALNEKLANLLTRQLGEVGIPVNVRFVDFAELSSALDRQQAQVFGLAWSSAYPDAEYNLQLFYGPNEPPASNYFAFKNDEYDRLYESIKILPPGAERDAAYARMQEIIVEYVPVIGSQARVRQYVGQAWLDNFKAVETFYNFPKYLDLDIDDPDRP
ncbi:MAG: ABC transporter substrate-binding protein [Planctomycetota bacterium]